MTIHLAVGNKPKPRERVYGLIPYHNLKSQYEIGRRGTVDEVGYSVSRNRWYYAGDNRIIAHPMYWSDNRYELIDFNTNITPPRIRR